MNVFEVGTVLNVPIIPLHHVIAAPRVADAPVWSVSMLTTT